MIPKEKTSALASTGGISQAEAMAMALRPVDLTALSPIPYSYAENTGGMSERGQLAELRQELVAMPGDLYEEEGIPPGLDMPPPGPEMPPPLGRSGTPTYERQEDGTWKQVGGSGQHPYMYIYDINDGTKHKINSKEGQTILSKYLKELQK